SWVVAGVTAIALSGDEFRDAVTIDINQSERVRLRKGFVNGMADPLSMIGSAGLLEPVQAIAVALAVDEIQLAIVVDVVAKDGETGVAKFPIRMPLPLVVVRVDLLKPAMRREHVRFAIAIDVGDADAVTVLFATPEMVDAWLVFAEVSPKDT